LNSILNNNLAQFQNRFPSLFDLYKPQIDYFLQNQEQNQPVPFYELTPSKTGDLTATEKLSDGTILHLHSAYNPKREAENAVKAAEEEINKYSTTVFYGFGLGYHVVEWAKKYNLSGKKLVLLESDVFHFLAAMSAIDWSQVFTVPQLIIAASCPTDQVLQLLENPEKINLGEEGVSDTYFFDIPSFTKHDESYFSTVKEIVKRNKRKNEINAATLKKFGKLWTRNTEMNKAQLKNCKGINEYENCFTEKEDGFIVVGAGPTLEHSITKIKALTSANSHVKIICVETALHHLLRHQITPDFVILSDPQYWAYKHICGQKATESILITDISVYPAVFRFDCKEVRLMSAQFPLAKQFEAEAGLMLPDLGTGGSVASVAFNFAVFTGCKKIYLAGTDFSFPYKQSHVKGSSAEQTFHTNSTHIKTAENFTSASIFSANPQIAQSYKKTPVITDSRMKMFAWWFESRIAALPEVQVYTLSDDALNIPSVKVLL